MANAILVVDDSKFKTYSESAYLTSSIMAYNGSEFSTFEKLNDNELILNKNYLNVISD